MPLTNNIFFLTHTSALSRLEKNRNQHITTLCGQNTKSTIHTEGPCNVSQKQHNYYIIIFFLVHIIHHTFEICVDQVDGIKAKCFGMCDKTLPCKDEFTSIFSISSTLKEGKKLTSMYTTCICS